jgi:hypothetical protein
MNQLLKKIKSIIPSVNEEVYNNIDLNSLITYSAHILEKENTPFLKNISALVTDGGGYVSCCNHL